MSFKVAATLAGAFASVALAHGTVTGIKVDGTYQAGYDLSSYYKAQQGGEIPTIAAWSAENLDNGFVPPSDYGTSDIACHKKAAPGKTSLSVKAGGTVEFQWSAWPESHIGPVLTYVAKCSGKCTSADPATLKWVKIDAAGLDGTWAAADLIKNNNTWTTTVPETLAAGSYVFRHEIIALHGAGSKDGAQNYPQCFNIEITGSGSEAPAGTLGEALYSEDDAGILINIYTSLASYDIPGPTLAFADSGSAAATTVAAAAAETTTAAAATSAAVTSAATSAAETTTAAATTSTKAAVTSSSSTSSAAAATKTSSTCKKNKRRHARDVVKN